MPARAVTGMLALTLAVAACSVAPEQPAPVDSRRPAATPLSGTPGGPVARVTWAIPRDVTGLDPLSTRDPLTTSVLANVCESLLRVAPDGRIVPGLAGVRRQGALSWVYTLSPDATFSDGSPVRPADVVASLTRRIAVAGQRPGPIRNIRSVEATGARTVTVTLRRPDALVNELLAGSAGVVVQRAGTSVRPGGAPVCSGPYEVARWDRGRALTLRRSAAYWQPAEAALATEVSLRVVSRPADRVTALRRGTVQGTYDPDGTSLGQLRGDANLRVTYGPSTAAVSLAVTSFSGPLRDLRLRRALSLAVDRDALVRAAPVGGATPAKAPAATGQWGFGGAAQAYVTASGTPSTGSGLPSSASGSGSTSGSAGAGAADDGARWFVNLPPVRRSVDDARRLVVAAGVPERPIVLATGPDAQSRAIGALVKDATVTSGLPVVLQPLGAAEYDALVRDPASRPDIDLRVQDTTSEIADPLLVYGRFCAGEEDELAGAQGLDVGIYREECARARAEPDRGRRLGHVDELQKIAVGAHLWIPLYEMPSVVVERREVVGAIAGFPRLASPWAARIGAT